MIDKPDIGAYFFITTRTWGYMAGKIIESCVGNIHCATNDEWEVKILKTDMHYYKGKDTAIIYLSNNPAITVEYFEHEYELLAKII